MDHAACHVVYVDKRAYGDRYEKNAGPNSADCSSPNAGSASLVDFENREVQMNLQTILSIFYGVYVCTSGISCMDKLMELNESIGIDLKPTIIIIDTLVDLDVDNRPIRGESNETPEYSPFTKTPLRREFSASSEPEDIYSFSLLQHIATEISDSTLSRLIIPIAMTHNWEIAHAVSHPTSGGRPSRPSSHSFNRLSEPPRSIDRDPIGLSAPVDPRRMMKCLEAGAVDVLTSPLQKDRVYGLTAHAYRAHKEAAKDQTAFLATKRLRKRSWVGVDEQRPYSYLRESMVSSLMTSICKPESVLAAFDQRSLYILDRRQELDVAGAIGTWGFSAHDFSDDELVHAAFLMLQHALDMPELGRWRLPTDDLKNFLMACRAAYNGFVLYHNFRHVVDVLQAVFYFLLKLGILPPYPVYSSTADASKPISPIAALLKPFDALTLLISAIGHDVGHPGVNNAFLVALKAPLAQLYNDSSVLEAFHCAAYSQILRRYWNVAFEDTEMRRLLIKSILATDMGVHFKYMTDLGNLQEKLHHNKGTDGWNDKLLDEYRTLACGLLIKCADISNVARPFETAAKWSDILQLEFARQGEMEKDVGIPTTLFGGPPELGNLTKLANSQIGFMNIFANPLFESVADILPAMQFAVDEIAANQNIWKAKIEEEKTKVNSKYLSPRHLDDGFRSPRSSSPNRTFSQSEFAHPEGLPASGVIPSLPTDDLAIAPVHPVDRESRRSSLGSVSVLHAGNKSTSPSQNPSRRSSLGNPLINTSPSTDTMSFSRRSSGAFPATHTLPPALTTRRSSNNVPSQLQLSLFPGRNAASTQMDASSPAVMTENAQPPHSSQSKRMQDSETPGLLTDTDTLSGGGAGGNIPRGNKWSSIETSPPAHHLYQQQHPRPSSNHHSTQPSPGRYSALSASQDRYSNATSGAHTFTSHALPTSPTDTQATSFITDGSDEKYYAGNGNCDDGPMGIPEVVDAERPGSGKQFGGNVNRDGNKDHEVKTSVDAMNGTVGNRIVRKKGSKFRFDFWKRRGKGLEASP